MKKRFLILAVWIIAGSILIGAIPAFAEEQPPVEPPVEPPVRERPRFIDEDGDGFNDNVPGRNFGLNRAAESGRGLKIGLQRNQNRWSIRNQVNLENDEKTPPRERGLENAIDRLNLNLMRQELIRERLMQREQMLQDREGSFNNHNQNQQGTPQ